MVDAEISKQIIKIEQRLVKNPDWQDTHQLAIYKAWRSLFWDHQAQIHLVEGRRI